MQSLPTDIQQVIFQYLDPSQSQMRLSSINQDWFDKDKRTNIKKQNSNKEFLKVMGFPQNPIDNAFKDAEIYLTPYKVAYSCSGAEEYSHILQDISDSLLLSRKHVIHCLISNLQWKNKSRVHLPYQIYSTTLDEPVYIIRDRKSYVGSTYRISRVKARRIGLMDSLVVKALIY